MMKQDFQKSIYKLIPKVCAIAVFSILAFFLSILWWTSTVMTSYIPGQGNEKVYFVKDLPYVKIPVFLLFLAGLLFLYRTPFWKKIKEKAEEEKTYTLIKRGLLFTIFALSLFWVASTQSQPAYDQDSVLSAAGRIFSSDFHDFFPKEYMGIFSNQQGLVFWEYIFLKFVGPRNTISILILNAFLVMIIWKKLAAIGVHFGMSRMAELTLLFCGVLFWPLILYSSFIYGTIPGMAFSLIAIAGMLKFLEGGKWYFALITGLFWVPAVGVKENYLIFLIGALIYFVIEAFRQKAWLKFWYPAAVVILVLISSSGTKAFLEQKTGMEFSPGISPWAYVAMGLSENPGKANGWYNSYVRNSYSELGYDTAAQEENAKKLLEDYKEKFDEDHAFRNKFFLNKTVSQWDDPTFESFWVNQTRGNALVLSKWAKRMRNDSVLHPLRILLDVFMFFVYSGALLFVLFYPEKKAFRYTIFGIIFIGGFLFHLFWEAKTQYTLPYFVLIIPYAIMGVTAFLKTIGDYIFPSGKKKKKKKTLEPFFKKPGFYFPAGMAALGFLLLISVKSTDSWLDTAEDSETVKTYLAEEKEKLNPPVEDGTYRIREVSSGAVIYLGNEWRETDDNGENERIYYETLISKDKQNAAESILTIRTFNDISRIFYTKDAVDDQRYQVLETYDKENEEHRLLRAARMATRREQEWRIQKEENGYFTIWQDREHVFTYDPGQGRIYLAPYDDTLSARQSFEFIPAGDMR